MDHLHCDVLIIGAGPAGLAAALAVGESRKKIVILDDNPLPGGQIWRDGPGVKLPVLARHYRQAVEALDNLTWLKATKVVAQSGPQQLLYENALSCGTISYQQMILCCGARELLLPFPGWTLPGVTGAGGLQAQIKNGLVVKNQKVAIAGSGPLLLAVADSVRKAGGQVVLLAEQTSLAHLARLALGLWRWPAKLRQSYQLISPHQLPNPNQLFNRYYRTRSYVLAAQGEQRLESIQVQQGKKIITLACDRLACGFGLVANIELAMLLGCQIADNCIAVNEWQQTTLSGIYAAGECTGIGGSELALAEGAIAGYMASNNPSSAQALLATRGRWQHFADTISTTFALDPRLKSLGTPSTLLCRCEDVALGQITHQSGWTAAKLNQRCGMGACQGKMCATAARHLFDWPLPTPRVPLAPVRTETLAAFSEERISQK